MRHSVDIVLLLGALGFGGYLATTADDPTTNELATRQDNVLPAFEASSILRIVIRTPQFTVVLRRENPEGDVHEYFLGESGRELAEQGAVAELLSALEFAPWQRRISPEKTLDELGLRPPQITLELEAESRSFRLLLGSRVPQENGNVYAALQNTSGALTLGTIKADLLTLLQNGKQAFRGRALFPLPQSQTKSITFESPSSSEPSLELEADGLGFVVRGARPQAVRADRRLVDLIFHHLARASLELFLDPKSVVSLQEKAKARRRVVQSGDELAADVVIGGPCPDDDSWTLAMRRSPQPIAGCVGGDIFAALQIASPDLLDRAPLPFNADEVDHVVVEVGERRLDLLRKDASYVLLGRDRLVPQEVGDEFLAVLAEARFELLSAPPNTVRRVGTITAKGHTPRTALGRTNDESGDGEHELLLEVYSGNKKYFLKRLDDGAWLEVPDGFEWVITGDDGWARDRNLVDLQSSQIQSVEIRSVERPSTTVIRKDAHFVLDSGGPADQSLTQELLETLAQLKAVRFLPSQERPNQGLLEVRFQTNSRLFVLWIGGRVRGGHEAWSNFADGRFVLPTTVRSTIETSLIDRSPVVLDPDHLNELSLTFDGRRYELERQGDELIPSLGIAKKDMTAPLRAALLGLEVSEALLRTRARVAQEPALLRLSGTRKLEGRVEKFEISWGQPTSLRGYPMIPAFVTGDPHVYFITRKSADALLELL